MPSNTAAPAGLLRGRPFASGYDPRRSLGPVSAAEREFRRLLEAEHIPKAGDLLRSVYERAIAGDMQAAGLFFKVCRLIQRPTDDAAIEALAGQLVDRMVAEARARKAAQAEADGRFFDLGTEE